MVDAKELERINGDSDNKSDGVKKSMGDLLAEQSLNFNDLKKGMSYPVSFEGAFANNEYVLLGVSNRSGKEVLVDADQISADPNFVYNKDTVIEYLQGLADLKVRIIENIKGGSYKGTIKQIEEDEKKLIEAKEAIVKGPFNVLVKEIERNGKGLLADFKGIGIFIPLTHVALRILNKDKLEEFVGKEILVEYIPPKNDNNEEFDRSTLTVNDIKKHITASRRLVLERERQEKEDKFWDSIHVGDIVHGTVRSIKEFGAFVKVNGKDCLVHKSELSWSRVDDITSVLKQNDKLDFLVISVDREQGKVSLSLRELLQKPFEQFVSENAVGSVVTGKVVKIIDKGMYINLLNGLDGFVPISEIAYKFVSSLENLYKVGDEVEAKVITIKEDGKITLSIKALSEAPVKEEDNSESNVIDEKEQEEVVSKKKVVNEAKFANISTGGNATKAKKKALRKNDVQFDDKLVSSIGEDNISETAFGGLDLSAIKEQIASAGKEKK